MQVSGATILFDVDGVLSDSTPAVARVGSQWARERGFDAEEVVRMTQRRPRFSIIRDVLPGRLALARDEYGAGRRARDLI